jgi:hypothetical protein
MTPKNQSWSLGGRGGEATPTVVLSNTHPTLAAFVHFAQPKVCCACCRLSAVRLCRLSFGGWPMIQKPAKVDPKRQQQEEGDVEDKKRGGLKGCVRVFSELPDCVMKLICMVTLLLSDADLGFTYISCWSYNESGARSPVLRMSANPRPGPVREPVLLGVARRLANAGHRDRRLHLAVHWRRVPRRARGPHVLPALPPLRPPQRHQRPQDQTSRHVYGRRYA